VLLSQNAQFFCYAAPLQVNEMNLWSFWVYANEDSTL